jgi:hypothetical protein
MLHPTEAGNSTMQTAERKSSLGPPPSTADSARRRRSARLRLRAPLRRSAPRSCPPWLVARRSGGDRPPLARCRPALLRVSVRLPPSGKMPLEPKRARPVAELAVTRCHRQACHTWMKCLSIYQQIHRTWFLYCSVSREEGCLGEERRWAHACGYVSGPRICATR